MIYTSTPSSKKQWNEWAEQAMQDYPDPAIEQKIRSIAEEGMRIDASWKKIVEAIDEWRRDACSNCDGTGFFADFDEEWPCGACAPFSAELD